MLSLNRRAVLAALGTNLPAGPLLAQGRDPPGLGRDRGAVKPLLAANIGKPDHAKAKTEEIATAVPAYQQPRLLTLGLSRALQS